LGTRLPRLLVLDVSDREQQQLPGGLTQLTRLHVDRVERVRNMGQYSRLKQVRMVQGTVWNMPYMLRNLPALQGVDLGWGGDWDNGPWEPLPDNPSQFGPLPSLRSLRLVGQHAELLMQGLGGLGAPHLTYMTLGLPSYRGVHWPRVAAMGALPQLQQLQLYYPDACPDTAWLQQQPSLTSLRLTMKFYSGYYIEAAWLEQLPLQLVELDLFGSTVQEGDWEGLSRLVNLRRLGLDEVRTRGDQESYVNRRRQHLPERQLPAWLASLVHLEELDVCGWLAEGGWEVLARLPMLWRVDVSRQVEAAALQHVPHLCWEK
jgi:hypothetical protein